jgi:hypothetical protein
MFFFSATIALFSTVLILISAAIWTILIKKIQGLNPSLGIEVSLGQGLLLMWAAFACLFLSVIPYMIR